MVRCSNIVLGFMNFLTMVVGIGMLIGLLSIHSHEHWQKECMKLLMHPLLIIAIIILVFSLVGLIGACCESNFCLWIYMFLLTIYLLGLLVAAGFMFYVAGANLQTKELVQKTWVQNNMVGKNWHSLKNCLVRGKVCQDMNSTATNLVEFMMEKRTPIEDNCCRPPQDCGFEFMNATVWKVPKSGLVKNDGDCKIWSNQPDAQCFDCDRCKEAFVGDLRKDAKYIGIGLIFEIVFVLFILSIGCCVKKNNDRNSSYP
ncbi:Tetraspanin/Peripherin [Corchorus capsularis]|uniref:Tetraspanin/Peripherin n=1 Tax=Corchorus capsularis TaxID=210143 RepID=A0A1R3GCQ0_COCAP|nr:Tetraspanin/Peripherin [Corchorus capsularis]